MKVNLLGAGIGAEITGIDVNTLDDATFDAVYDAFLAHSVIVVRDQQVDIPQLLEFSRRFGPVRAHINRNKNNAQYPEVLEVDNRAQAGKPADMKRVMAAAHWHSDMGYERVPAKATALYGVHIPSSGGNTQFNSMYRAYEALPPALKLTVDRKRGLFNWGGKTRRNWDQLPPEEQNRPPVAHDMVQVHPETGKPCLYLSPSQILGVEGMAEEESEALLNALYEYTNKPADYAHKWIPGDLVVWDNRCLLHRAMADYPLEERRLHLRTSIMKDTQVRGQRRHQAH